MTRLQHLLSHVRALRVLVKGVTKGVVLDAASPDPIILFKEWYADAEESGLLLPEAMNLATATPEGRPSARMVLMKGVDSDGIRFFTNYGSRKARELDSNPYAALCFHWSVLERQVRIEGFVERLERSESEAYFSTRSRGSRVGAWASRQSSPIRDREMLEAQVQEREMEFEGQKVALPDFWGGYRLRPHRMEFWQGRANRLHDRIVYLRDDQSGIWRKHRLQP